MIKSVDDLTTALQNINDHRDELIAYLFKKSHAQLVQSHGSKISLSELINSWLRSSEDNLSLVGKLFTLKNGTGKSFFKYAAKNCRSVVAPCFNKYKFQEFISSCISNDPNVLMEVLELSQAAQPPKGLLDFNTIANEHVLQLISKKSSRLNALTGLLSAPSTFKEVLETKFRQNLNTETLTTFINDILQALAADENCLQNSSLICDIILSLNENILNYSCTVEDRYHPIPKNPNRQVNITFKDLALLSINKKLFFSEYLVKQLENGALFAPNIQTDSPEVSKNKAMLHQFLLIELIKTDDAECINQQLKYFLYNYPWTEQSQVNETAVDSFLSPYFSKAIKGENFPDLLLHAQKNQCYDDIQDALAEIVAQLTNQKISDVIRRYMNNRTNKAELFMSACKSEGAQLPIFDVFLVTLLNKITLQPNYKIQTVASIFHHRINYGDQHIIHLWQAITNSCLVSRTINGVSGYEYFMNKLFRLLAQESPLTTLQKYSSAIYDFPAISGNGKNLFSSTLAGSSFFSEILIRTLNTNLLNNLPPISYQKSLITTLNSNNGLALKRTLLNLNDNDVVRFLRFTNRIVTPNQHITNVTFSNLLYNLLTKSHTENTGFITLFLMEKSFLSCALLLNILKNQVKLSIANCKSIDLLTENKFFNYFKLNSFLNEDDKLSENLLTNHLFSREEKKYLANLIQDIYDLCAEKMYSLSTNEQALMISLRIPIENPVELPKFSQLPAEKIKQVARSHPEKVIRTWLRHTPEKLSPSDASIIAINTNTIYSRKSSDIEKIYINLFNQIKTRKENNNDIVAVSSLHARISAQLGLSCDDAAGLLLSLKSIFNNNSIEPSQTKLLINIIAKLALLNDMFGIYQSIAACKKTEIIRGFGSFLYNLHSLAYEIVQKIEILDTTLSEYIKNFPSSWISKNDSHEDSIKKVKINAIKLSANIASLVIEKKITITNLDVNFHSITDTGNTPHDTAIEEFYRHLSSVKQNESYQSIFEDQELKSAINTALDLIKNSPADNKSEYQENEILDMLIEEETNRSLQLKRTKLELIETLRELESSQKQSAVASNNNNTAQPQTPSFAMSQQFFPIYPSSSSSLSSLNNSATDSAIDKTIISTFGTDVINISSSMTVIDTPFSQANWRSLLDKKVIENYAEFITHKKPIIGVINTSCSKNGGSHWVLLAIIPGAGANNATAYLVEPYFSSFTAGNDEHEKNLKNAFKDLFKLELDVKLRFTNQQAEHSQECGWWAIYNAIMLIETKSDDYLNKSRISFSELEQLFPKALIDHVKITSSSSQWAVDKKKLLEAVQLSAEIVQKSPRQH